VLKTVHDFEMTALDGSKVHLSRYRGRVLLIVNVASKCGFTGQYAGLQKLYEQFFDRGFDILGFPCNQFLWQEPGGPDRIQACPLKYGVTFPVFEKVKVNGMFACDLYRFLKQRSRGTLGTQLIKWNFTKFLINRRGEPVRRFGPLESPGPLEPFICELLDQPSSS
jgi:glutathione peroxidase